MQMVRHDDPSKGPTEAHAFNIPQCIHKTRCTTWIFKDRAPVAYDRGEDVVAPDMGVAATFQMTAGHGASLH
jgi:hypothetical protein